MSVQRLCFFSDSSHRIKRSREDWWAVSHMADSFGVRLEGGTLVSSQPSGVPKSCPRFSGSRQPNAKPMFKNKSQNEHEWFSGGPFRLFVSELREEVNFDQALDAKQAQPGRLRVLLKPGRVSGGPPKEGHGQSSP